MVDLDSCAGAIADDGVVDGASDRSSRRGLAGLLVATDHQAASAVVGQNIVDDHRSWSQQSCVERQQVARCSGVRSRSDVGSELQLVPVGAVDQNSYLSAVPHEGRRDDHLPLITQTVAVPQVLAKCRIETVEEECQ